MINLIYKTIKLIRFLIEVEVDAVVGVTVDVKVEVACCACVVVCGSVGGCVDSVNVNDNCVGVVCVGGVCVGGACVGRVCVGGCSVRVSKKLLSQHSCFSLQQIFRIFSFAFFDFVFEVFFVVSSFVVADVVFGAVVTNFVDWFRTFGLVVLIRSDSSDGLTVGFNPFFEFIILEG